MAWINRLKIGPRLMLGFATVLLLAGAIMGLGLLEVQRVGRGLHDMSSFGLVKAELLRSLEGAALERAIAARNLVLLGDGKQREVALAQIAEAKKRIDASSKDMLALLERSAAATDDDRKRLSVLQDIEARYWPVAEGIVKLAVAGQRDEAAAKLGEQCNPLLAELRDSLAKFSEAGQKASAMEVADLQAEAAMATMMLLGLGLTALLVGGGVAWAIQRSVTTPLGHAGGSMQRIAAGDLTEIIQVRGRDEVADMQGALVQMQRRLHEVVGNIHSGVAAVNSASVEIASGNQDLGARTEQTASNLQQAAASMEQLTGTVKQSADSARQASQLATSATEVAQRGGSVVAQVVSTMDEINTSSKKIADIIGTIDGIAFQTNILALNAAVEAARAGEQGRGFAVVAAEVRTLAQRSAEAAREIKGLIGASVDKVEAGSKLVSEAGQTMNEIVNSVRRVTDIIGEISAAAAEQSDGIGQVNTAVAQLDEMTQQNAALVEQSSAAAESLKGQASHLAQVMGAFKLA